MSQRQFDRVTRQVPWPRVLVEGVVIVASKSIITISPELVTVLARRTSLQANILIELEGIRDRLRSIVSLIDGEIPGDAP